MIASTMAAAQTAPPASPAAAATPPASAPATVSLSVPAMAGPLGFPASPTTLDAGPLGTWLVDAVGSGIGLAQSQAGTHDRAALGDISNGFVIVQKISGVVQFYAQAGAYGLPAIGVPYTHVAGSANTFSNDYGAAPQYFIKLQPTDAFSVQAGNLPTLIGAEYTFTFENMDIERGLLWSQEPAISRGVQVNYALDKVAFSLSLNDGYYSNRFGWISGSATWTPTAASTLAFAAAGNTARTSRNTIATPLVQNNSAIYNLIYTYSAAPLVITPYLQFSHVAADPAVGIDRGGSTYAVALLGSYAINGNWSAAARAEYLGSTGSGGALSNDPNFLYGPGSKAISFTVTPTWTRQRLFIRGDISVAHILDLTDGDGFGSSGQGSTQVRGVVEAGVIF